MPCCRMGKVLLESAVTVKMNLGVCKGGSDSTTLHDHVATSFPCAHVERRKEDVSMFSSKVDLDGGYRVPRGEELR